MNPDEKEILKLQTKYNYLDLNRYSEYGYTQTEILRLKEAFDLFDTEEKGFLDINELQKDLSDMGMMSKNKDLQNLLIEGKEKIDFNKFVEIFGAKPVCRNEEEAKKLFSVFLGDYDFNRKLNADDIKKVADELGLEMAENEIEEMIKSVNPKEPDCISFEEFFRVMAKMEI